VKDSKYLVQRKARAILLRISIHILGTHYLFSEMHYSTHLISRGKAKENEARENQSEGKEERAVVG
jgi:hypothetical protein